MKLKYYMRGLGIGIILTTLILSISNTKEILTDKEIMERAAELGMVTQEESNSPLKQVLEGIKPTGINLKPSTTPEPTAEPTEIPIEPTVFPTAAPTPEPTVEPTQESQEEQIEEPTPTAISIDNNANTGKEISFTIKSGMSSGKVAALLFEVGLIEDADDFNKYIVDKGKASIIRVGTYTLPEGASYLEIVKLITSK